MTAQTQTVQARDFWFGRNNNHAANAGIKVDNALHQDILQAAQPKVAKAYPVYTSSIGHGTYPFMTHPQSAASAVETGAPPASGPRDPLATMVQPVHTADEPHFKYGVVMDESRHHPMKSKRDQDNATERMIEKAEVEDEYDEDYGDEEEHDDDDDDDEEDDEDEEAEEDGKFRILPILKRFRSALQASEGYEDYEYENEFVDKSETEYTYRQPSLDYDGKFVDEIASTIASPGSPHQKKKHLEENDEVGRARPESLLNRALHHIPHKASPVEEIVVEKRSVKVEEEPEKHQLTATQETLLHQAEQVFYDTQETADRLKDQAARAAKETKDLLEDAAKKAKETINHDLNHPDVNINNKKRGWFDFSNKSNMQDMRSDVKDATDKIHNAQEAIYHTASSAPQSVHDSEDAVLNAAARSLHETQDAVYHAAHAASKSFHDSQVRRQKKWFFFFGYYSSKWSSTNALRVEEQKK